MFNICRVVQILVWMLVSTNGLADEIPSPDQVIISTIQQLQFSLAKEADKLQKTPDFIYEMLPNIFSPSIDFPRVGSLALGKYWRRANKQQRQLFVLAFRDFMMRSYARALLQRKGWRIDFLPSTFKPGSKKAVVRTEVVLPDRKRPVAVAYRMHLRHGKWKAYDVTVEGISLVTTYRATFSCEARKKGLDSLIQRLNNPNVDRKQTTLRCFH